MNNSLNKHLCLYIEQINYLSGPQVSYLILFPLANRVDPDQAAELIWVCSVCKGLKRCFYEVKGYIYITLCMLDNFACFFVTSSADFF